MTSRWSGPQGPGRSLAVTAGMISARGTQGANLRNDANNADASHVRPTGMRDG